MNEAVTQTDLIAELHQLRTQLERAMVNAERYDKLRAWMLSPDLDGDGDLVDFREARDADAWDAAVDALPEPEAK
jgi:hypothetical protein